MAGYLPRSNPRNFFDFSAAAGKAVQKRISENLRPGFGTKSLQKLKKNSFSA